MIPQSISRLIAEDIKMRLVVFPLNHFSLRWSIVIICDWTDVFSIVGLQKPPVWWADLRGGERLTAYWTFAHCIARWTISPFLLISGDQEEKPNNGSGSSLASASISQVPQQTVHHKEQSSRSLLPRKYSAMLLLLLPLRGHMAGVSWWESWGPRQALCQQRAGEHPGNLWLTHQVNSFIYNVTKSLVGQLGNPWLLGLKKTNKEKQHFLWGKK